VLERLNGKIEGYDVDHEFGIMIATIEEERRESALLKSQSFTQVRTLQRPEISWYF
jgi:hypothetical protein